MSKDRLNKKKAAEFYASGYREQIYLVTQPFLSVYRCHSMMSGETF